MNKEKVVSQSRTQVELKNVQIIFANFKGVRTQFNAAGDRNFCIVLDEETAIELMEKGWNVKEKPDKVLYIRVNIKRNDFVSHAVEIAERVDVLVHPYQWTVGEHSGVKLYMDDISVHQKGE